MSSYGGKELASAFRTVRKNTIQVAVDIPESQYGHVAAPECKSVARMLAHIGTATRIWDEIDRKRRLTTLAGLNFQEMRDRFDAEESRPRSKAEIVELLRTDGKTQKSRFERLLSAKEHEMHHRGQLMLIERQLGIVPHVTRQFNERMAAMRAAKA